MPPSTDASPRQLCVLSSSREHEQSALRQNELTIALQKLETHLQIASQYNPAAADHGRSSVIVALIGILQFLSVLYWRSPSLPLPLQDLLQALVDLDRGASNGLLQPLKACGRPPTRLGDGLFRAIVAAAMTKRLEDPEMDLDLAAREIKRMLVRLGFPDSKIEHKQIGKWREKMMEGDFEDRAVQRYRLALEWVKAFGPMEGADFLLGHLPALHPAGFAKTPGEGP